MFNIFLPISQKPDSAIEAELNPAAPIQGGTETILVVEDEQILRELAVVILRDCGYHVLEAATGVEATEIWNRHRNLIDLLLTDMVMPEGISGVELAEQLISQKPDLRVVFTSGYSVSDTTETDFIRKGRADFLQKPYTRVTLAKSVRDCLDKNVPVKVPVAV